MSKKLDVDFYTTIRGIPAGVVIEDCDPAEPGLPPQPYLAITDRKGYPAHWLEEQMTNSDYWEVEQEAREWIESENEKSKLDWL